MINVGYPSTFDTLTTNTNATAFNTGYASTITGSSRTYNAPVVIVRYKYTRPQIQAQTIDSNYKYISFPNTGENQTVYSMNFPEATEVQLLLLNDTNMKDITPLTITTGNVDINVGSTGASTFSTYDTSESPTSYTNHESSITGTSITYTDSVVIVRYKTTKTVITQVGSYGFLKYMHNNVWEVSNEMETIINNLITRIETL